MFGHCYGVSTSHFFENPSLFACVIRKILTGGTIFFVFISGYLFHYIYYKNFQFSSFIIKKVRFVLIPFLLVSSADLLYYTSGFLVYTIKGSFKAEIFLTKLNSYSFINTFLYGRGDITIVLWYVPFIMTIFALSPFYIKFIKIKPKAQLIMIFILLIISIIINRNSEYSILGLFQNVIYFTPVYLLGIYVSMNFNMIKDRLIKWQFYFLLTAIGLAFAQTRYGVQAFRELNASFLVKIDLMIIQKTLLSIFFILFFMRYEIKKIGVLNLMAENSFGIFFIHGICIWFLNAKIFKLKIAVENDSFLFFFGVSTFILTISLFITILIRKVFPTKSKYIIGC